MLIRVLVGLALGALPLVVASLLFRRMRRLRSMPLPRVLGAGLLGAGLHLPGWALERLVLEAGGISLRADTSGPILSLLAMLAFAAPLQQGSLLLAVWPLYLRRALLGRRLGLTYAAVAAAGHAAVDAVLRAVWAPTLDGLLAVRVVLSQPMLLICAALWGLALGASSLRGRSQWFATAWLGGTVFMGLHRHVVFAQGPGMLTAAAPLLAVALLVAWLVLRDLLHHDAEQAPATTGRGRLEPPSLGTVQQVLARSDRPLLVHWVVIGAFVTFGAMLVGLSLSVWVGHEVGVDFSAANETDVRSAGPLVLLGSGGLAAFPCAGYLVARASQATTVWEPAVAASLAIATVVVLVFMAAPASVVFALAVAPIALALACAGAWLGLSVR